MRNPHNTFKQALREKRVQIGLWMTSTSSYLAEIAATSGYDWLLFDGEHAPNTAQDLRMQLQAVGAYGSHAAVRPLEGSTALIKQALDTGAQTLLIPMVDTAEQARAAVRAVQYPPKGVRGVGASVARAARWGRIEHYMRDVEQELCLLVQAETVTAMNNLDEILKVDGVDGVFIGPADLSASMGHPDDAGHPEVMAAIEGMTKKIVAAGKAAGFLAVTVEMANKCLEWGATFVAVGVDTMLYMEALDARLGAFKKTVKTAPKASY